ncbi:MAG: hypothetical protein ACOX7J_07340 [Bacillota bacterium]
MKKFAIIGLLLILPLAVLSGCGEDAEDKSAESAAPEKLTATFLYDDFSGENGSSNRTPYEMSAEDVRAAYDIFTGAEIAGEGEGAYFASIYSYRIEFSDGTTYEFDSGSFNGFKGESENFCGYLTEEEYNSLAEIMSHYTEGIEIAFRPAYDMGGDSITLYYHNSEGWQSLELKNRAAKKIVTILNIEEITECHEPVGDILYYLDFHNGTAVTVYEEDMGTVSIGVDSAVYDEWIKDGDDPTITFDRAFEITKLPAGTTETIEEAMKNPEENWE